MSSETKLALVEINPLDIDIETFFNTIFDPQYMLEGECGFLAQCISNSKGKTFFKGFRGTPPNFEKVNVEKTANYYCVSTVIDNPTSLKRTRNDCMSAMVLGLDDIGTKGKEPSIKPSYIMETSPNNFQWGYLIEPYKLDGTGGERTLYYEACVRGLVEAGLGDKGAGGCYRLLRVPGSYNTKPKNNGFRSQVTYWAPENCWALEELMKELGVEPLYEKNKKASSKGNRVNDVLFDWLKTEGKVIKDGSDFCEIECPWSNKHSEVDKPEAHYSPKGLGTNGRQFNCFHSHCAGITTDEFLTHMVTLGAPDVGTVHDVSLLAAEMMVELALQNDDAGQWFEPDMVNALKIIYSDNKPAYYRLRTRLKAVTDIGPLESAIKGARFVDEPDALTHNGIAKALLGDMTAADDCKPISTMGALYRCKDGVWTPYTRDSLIGLVANSQFDGDPVCRVNSHYKGVSELVQIAVEQESFFNNAPAGVAAGGQFYSVSNKGVNSEILTADHRCYFQLPAVPEAVPTPMFDAFLAETFKSDDPSETAAQIKVLQEIMGGLVTGVMHRFQKAALFYGETRAGKGVMAKIMTEMMPSDVVGASDPFKWEQEYYIAQLAGLKANFVGEFNADKKIPATPFKQVLGCDRLSGRQPSGRVFNFTATAGHIFSGNYHPYCTEQSAAFYGRWITLNFAHTKPEAERDMLLPEKIIDAELSGILHWALLGGVRLLAQNGYSVSPAHDKVMTDWRLRGDSVARFVAETGLADLEGCGGKMPAQDFYGKYETWCIDSDYSNATGRNKFYERLRSILTIVLTRFEDGLYVVAVRQFE
jgi:hypothetical protein